MKSEKKSFEQRFHAVIWLMGIFLLDNLCQSLAYSLPYPFLQGVGLLLTTVLILFIARRMHLFSSFHQYNWSKSLGVIVGGFFLTKLLTTLGNIILVMEMGVGAETANQAAIESWQVPAAVLFLDVVVHAPIVEELLFRRLLQGGVFADKSIAGLLISSILFAFLHTPTNWGSWVIYGGMGLSWGLVYFWSQKVEYAIAVHLINNLIGFIVMIYS